MEFGVEHLYHDNTTSALDAREKLRTRQINAREEKQLRRYNRILDRAHSVLVKRQNWEKTHLLQQLESTKLKTNSLDKSLKRELDAEIGKDKLPIITTSSNSLIKSHSADNSYTSDANSPHKSKLFRRSTISIPGDLRYSAEILPFPSADTNGSQDTESVYMKKADVIARNLHRLYKRKKERDSYIRQAVEIIRVNNQELGDEARIYMLEKSLSTGSDKEPGKKSKGEENSSVHSEDLKDFSKKIKHVQQKFKHDVTGKDVVTVVQQDENNNTHQTLVVNDKVLPKIERVSSVIANASDGSFDDKNAKWTDIFRIPEMWKLFDNRKKNKDTSKQAPALVTIRGKLRKTLLK